LKVARAEGGARIVRSLTGEAAMLERLADLDVPRLIKLGERDGLPYLAIEWQSGTHPTQAAAEFRPAITRHPVAGFSTCASGLPRHMPGFTSGTWRTATSTIRMF
jgi:hypothetical protein